MLRTTSSLLTKHSTSFLSLSRSRAMSTLPFTHPSTLRDCTFTYTPSPTSTPNSPLVVLIGWYASNAKNLSKYSDLHTKGISETGGNSTIAFTLPRPAVFGQRTQTITLQRQVLNDLAKLLVEDKRLPDSKTSPIVLHVLSNGGFFPLIQLPLLPESVEVKSLRNRVIGLIADSSPCYLHSQAGARAFAYGFGATEPGSFIEYALTPVFLLQGLISLATSGINTQEEFWSGCKDRDWRVGCNDDNVNATNSEKYVPNEMFIYSNNDALCDDALLGDLVEHRKQRLADTKLKGGKVTSKKFEGSKHVLHFRDYEKEYTKLTKDFVEMCVKDAEGVVDL